MTRPNDLGDFACHQVIYRDGVKQESLLPESEVIRNYDGLDFYVNLAHMELGVLMADGSIFTPDRALAGIKGHPLTVLCKVMRRPGLYHTPYEIGNLPPYHDSHFINANIVQYIAKLRRNLFREYGLPRHLLTLRDPYRVAVNGELDFLLIERASILEG